MIENYQKSFKARVVRDVQANGVQIESEMETDDSEEEEKGILLNVSLLFFCVFLVVTFQQFITF